MTLYKIFKYVAMVIGAIATYFAIRVLIAGEDIITSADLQSGIVSPFIYLAYIALALLVFLTLFFAIKGLFTGDVKETLISAGSIAVIVLVAYLLTDGTSMEANGEVFSATVVHWVSAGLVVFYILGIAAIGTMVFGGIKKLIK